MSLFDGKPLQPDPDGPARRPTSQRELARRRAAQRRADREQAVHRETMENRPTPRRFDQEAAYARCREEAARYRRERLERFGVDPDAPDAEALYQAEEHRRNLLVQQGWTFIRGKMERMEDWLRDTAHERETKNLRR